MSYQIAEFIANITKNNEVKEVPYQSSVFRQSVAVNTDGDFEVNDIEHDVNIKLNIPVHTFESYIITLCDLRKGYDVLCTYSKEPISFENLQYYLDDDINYRFAYWNTVHDNVLYNGHKMRSSC